MKHIITLVFVCLSIHLFSIDLGIVGTSIQGDSTYSPCNSNFTVRSLDSINIAPITSFDAYILDELTNQFIDSFHWTGSLNIYDTATIPMHLGGLSHTINPISIFITNLNHTGQNPKNDSLHQVVKVNTKLSAGKDMFICYHQQYINLHATPVAGGHWTIISGNGGSLKDSTYAYSLFHVQPQTDYTLSWSVSTTCGVLADTIHVVSLGYMGSTINATICLGQSYPFNNQNLFISGVYHAYHSTIHDCDSIITLNLTVNSVLRTYINDTVCSGQGALYHGNIVYGGTFKDTFTAIGGCDSIVTLTVISRPANYKIIQASICWWDSYSFNGMNLTHTGIYKDTLTAVSGCDSLVVLYLTVTPPVVIDKYATICHDQSYAFGHDSIHIHFLNTTGLYTDTIPTLNGCDSIVRLHLTVVTDKNKTYNVTICQGAKYYFYGQYYNSTGVYPYLVKDSGGCDYYKTLNLTVTPYPTRTINVDLCYGQSYYFYGHTLSKSGIYYDTLRTKGNCDSLIVLNLNIKPKITKIIETTTCAGHPYMYGGVSYAKAGIYYYTKKNPKGCDTFVTIYLNVLPASSKNITAIICKGQTYPFHGQLLSSSGLYRDTLKAINGCDSFVTLTLTVQPTFSSTMNASICFGSSYNFYGQALTASGIYRDTLHSQYQCDSIIVLYLKVIKNVYTSTVNICQGGSYSFFGRTLTMSGIYYDTVTTGNCGVYVLNLIVNPKSDSAISRTLCAGQSYYFNGKYYSTTGIYKQTLKNKYGCDSTLTLNLTVLPAATKTIYDTFCYGHPYSYNGKLITSAGTYTYHYNTANKCDSIVTLKLSIRYPAFKQLSATICAEQSYPFHGGLLTHSGTYKDTLKAANGCDSFVYLTLTVLPSANKTIYANICAGQSYLFSGVLRTMTGVYKDSLKSKNNCDSIVTLYLNVYPAIGTTIYDTACAGRPYYFLGQYITGTGTYTHKYTAKNGCDSIVTLNLTVLPSTNDSIYATICPGEKYPFNGQMLTATGVYTKIIKGAKGCDKVTTLYLKVLPPNIKQTVAYICAGESYPFHGQNLTQPGTYLDSAKGMNSCDSMTYLSLIVYPTYQKTIYDTICDYPSKYKYTKAAIEIITKKSGTYVDSLHTIHGCDSIVTTHLTVHPISYTDIYDSACGYSTYYFDGHPLYKGGVYFKFLTNQYGCDSIVQLHFTRRPVRVATATICTGDSFTFLGHILTQSGHYDFTNSSNVSQSCDSALQLDLSVIPAISSLRFDTICEGQSVTIGGFTHSTTGEYTDTLTAISGCDSIVTEFLLVIPSHVEIVDTICAGGGYYFAGMYLTTTGIYVDSVINPQSCLTVIKLQLTVLPNAITKYDTFCYGHPYYFMGQYIYQAGVYHDSVYNGHGCYAIRTLFLTIKYPVKTTVYDTVCAGHGVFFHGTIVYGGTYRDTLHTIYGCDSIVTLNLTSIPKKYTYLKATTCANQPYLYHGKYLYYSGTYRDTLHTARGCDSIVSLSLTVYPVSYTNLTASIYAGQSYNFYGQMLTMAGVYYDTIPHDSLNRCDSYVKLVLSVKDSTKMAATQETAPTTTLQTARIANLEMSRLSLAPNPSSNEVSILNLEAGLSYSVVIYDLQGRKVSSHIVNVENATIDIHALDAATYQVFITSETNAHSIQRLVKY